MSKKQRQYSCEYKFKVALEAAKGTKTLVEIVSKTGVHPNQISLWKRQLLEDGDHVFSSNDAQQQREIRIRCWKPNCTSTLGDSRWSWNG